MHHTSPHVSVVITCSFDAFSEKKHTLLFASETTKSNANQSNAVYLCLTKWLPGEYLVQYFISSFQKSKHCTSNHCTLMRRCCPFI